MAKLFSTPKAPDIPPPAPMPEKTAPEVDAARKKALKAAAARAGRESTILTDYGGQRDGLGSRGRETLG